MNLTETNQKYCKDTIGLYRQSMVHLAERLWHIRSKEMWRGTWGSWEEFLGDLGLRKGTASKLCALYERIVVELEFPMETLHEAPWTNLYAALPMMEDKESAERAIASARFLTASELNETLYEHRHHKSCEHTRTTLLQHCLDCKSYIKVHEAD